jgi:O-antigen/teichoic acid export membrane protein
MSFVSSELNSQHTSVASLSSPAETRGQARTRMLHAVAWTGAATWATQLITWGYMIIVARMLTPSDYGLIGIANVLLGLLTVASEFGVANAVIMMPDLTQDQISQLNTVSVLSGMTLFAISCFVGYPLGRFFRVPHLPMVVITLGLALVITSFKTVPEALLQRELRFKLLAHIQAAQAVSYGFAAIIGALLGAGYWSLVLASVAGAMLSTLLVLRSRRHAFACPKLAALRRSLVFSTHVLGLRVAWYCTSNADFAVAGRMLGEAALGSYNIAWSVADQPLQKFTDLVTRVIPSYFSKVQNDPPALREYVLTITRALSLLTFPATLGLALVADDFVAVMLGPKWINSALPLRILAVYAAVRSITGFLVPLLNVTGQFRFVMWNHILAALYFTAAFYFCSRWGIVGIALVWPLLYPLIAVPLYLRVFKQINLRWESYWACVRPAASASTVMLVCLIIFKNALPSSTPIYWRLAAEIITGAGTYCLALSTLYRDELRRVYHLVQPAS